jgi:hypothetical protein
MDLKKGSSLYHAFKSKPLESNKSLRFLQPTYVDAILTKESAMPPLALLPRVLTRFLTRPQLLSR